VRSPIAAGGPTKVGFNHQPAVSPHHLPVGRAPGDALEPSSIWPFNSRGRYARNAEMTCWFLRSVPSKRRYGRCSVGFDAFHNLPRDAGNSLPPPSRSVSLKETTIFLLFAEAPPPQADTPQLLSEGPNPFAISNCQESDQRADLSGTKKFPLLQKERKIPAADRG